MPSIRCALDYWTPQGAGPMPVLPVPRPGVSSGTAHRVDWPAMLLVVAVATGGAFLIVVAMAWVLGH